MKYRAFLLVVTGFMIFAFQNCGQVSFSPAKGTLFVSGPAGGSDTGGTDTVPPTTIVPPPSGGGDTGGTTPPTTVGGTGDGSGSGKALVECELQCSNQKVAFSNSLSVSRSNASDTRVCMSSNACLNLVNAYAEARNCSLSPGPASTSTAKTAQFCSKVFPGSNGTCNNAQVLTDSQVAEILSSMASSH